MSIRFDTHSTATYLMKDFLEVYNSRCKSFGIKKTGQCTVAVLRKNTPGRRGNLDTRQDAIFATVRGVDYSLDGRATWKPWPSAKNTKNPNCKPASGYTPHGRPDWKWQYDELCIKYEHVKLTSHKFFAFVRFPANTGKLDVRITFKNGKTAVSSFRTESASAETNLAGNYELLYELGALAGSQSMHLGDTYGGVVAFGNLGLGGSSSQSSSSATVGVTSDGAFRYLASSADPSSLFSTVRRGGHHQPPTGLFGHAGPRNLIPQPRGFYYCRSNVPKRFRSEIGWQCASSGPKLDGMAGSGVVHRLEWAGYDVIDSPVLTGDGSPLLCSGELYRSSKGEFISIGEGPESISETCVSECWRHSGSYGEPADGSSLGRGPGCTAAPTVITQTSEGAVIHRGKLVRCGKKKCDRWNRGCRPVPCAERNRATNGVLPCGADSHGRPLAILKGYERHDLSLVRLDGQMQPEEVLWQTSFSSMNKSGAVRLPHGASSDAKAAQSWFATPDFIGCQHTHGRALFWNADGVLAASKSGVDLSWLAPTKAGDVKRVASLHGGQTLLVTTAWRTMIFGDRRQPYQSDSAFGLAARFQSQIAKGDRDAETIDSYLNLLAVTGWYSGVYGETKRLGADKTLTIWAKAHDDAAQLFHSVVSGYDRQVLPHLGFQEGGFSTYDSSKKVGESKWLTDRVGSAAHVLEHQRTKNEGYYWILDDEAPAVYLTQSKIRASNGKNTEAALFQEMGLTELKNNITESAHRMRGRIDGATCKAHLDISFKSSSDGKPAVVREVLNVRPLGDLVHLEGESAEVLSGSASYGLDRLTGMLSAGGQAIRGGATYGDRAESLGVVESFYLIRRDGSIVESLGDCAGLDGEWEGLMWAGPHIDVYSGAVGSLFDMGEIELAAGAIAAAKPDTSPAQLSYWRALELRADGKFKEAVALLDGVNESQSIALRTKAILLGEAGRLDESIMTWTQVMATPLGNQARSHSGLGLSYLRRGLIELAIASLLKASQLEPKNPVHDSNLAVAYQALDKRNDAMKYLYSGLGKAPKDPVLQLQMKMLQKKKKASPRDATIAMMPFDTAGGSVDRPGLGQSFASMLQTHLEKAYGLKLFERSRMDKVLEEQDRQSTERFDSATTVQFGKLAGAKQLILGNVTEFSGSVRIDVRLVDVKSGRVLVTSQASGEGVNLQTLEKLLTTVASELFKS